MIGSPGPYHHCCFFSNFPCAQLPSHPPLAFTFTLPLDPETSCDGVLDRNLQNGEAGKRGR